MITAKGVSLQDSSGPLLRLPVPLLFIEPSLASGCPTSSLDPLLPAMAALDVRHVTVQVSVGKKVAQCCTCSCSLRNTCLESVVSDVRPVIVQVEGWRVGNLGCVRSVW
jgi:hypothetical protein